MARYGTFSYSQEVYGESEITNLLYGLQIDWEGEGVWAHNEATRMIRCQVERGDDYYISADGRSFEPKKIGTTIITVDNYDGRYDPYNASSPLYGYLSPGKYVRLWVRDGSGGTDYIIIYGILQDIKPIGYHEEVDLIIEDGWRWLADNDVTIEMQEDVYADDAIGLIADAVGYPYGYELDSATDLINYWWTTGKRAKAEIEEVANSGIGHVYVANDGVLKYRARQRFNDAVLVIHEEHLLKDVIIPQPWEFQRNVVKIEYVPRELEDTQNVWQYRETVLIANGDTLNLRAIYTVDNRNVPVQDVLCEAFTDYSFNELENGSGLDRTNGFDVTVTEYSDSADIEIENNSGFAAYMILMKLRGKPIIESDTTIIIKENDEAATFPRVMELSMPWTQDYNIALDLSEYLIDFLGEPRYFPTVFVQDRPDIQFGLDVMDKVNVNLSTWGIDAGFLVGGIKHKFLTQNGQSVLTEIKLFPIYVPTVESYWEIGVSELGVDTYMGF